MPPSALARGTTTLAAALSLGGRRRRRQRRDWRCSCLPIRRRHHQIHQRHPCHHHPRPIHQHHRGHRRRRRAPTIDPTGATGTLSPPPSRIRRLHRPPSCTHGFYRYDNCSEVRRSTSHLRKNMTTAQRLREGDRIFGKHPTGRELAGVGGIAFAGYRGRCGNEKCVCSNAS